ncbi:MAG: hypothetical protein Q9185_004529 [Variospora sp. 1 TL-2023]
MLPSKSRLKFEASNIPGQQNCIPQGYGPPADCGSLSNLTCICRQGTFTAQIIACNQLGCSLSELADINTLIPRLCAPVGGEGPSLRATVSAILRSTQLSLSTTPTVPASATRASQVSSVLATETSAPDLGNPGNLASYPLCAQICNNETKAIAQAIGNPYGDLQDIQLLCGPRFRGDQAGCQTATCSPLEYQRSQLLAQQLCGSLYSTNAVLSTSVSSAIASATAAAQAATEGKDPTDVANLPICGVSGELPCLNPQRLGSEADAHVILGSSKTASSKITLTAAGASPTWSACVRAFNLIPLSVLASQLLAVPLNFKKLCEPVGGVLTNPVNYTGSPSNVTNGSTAPVPFIGEAAISQRSVSALIISGFMSSSDHRRKYNMLTWAGNRRGLGELADRRNHFPE